MPTNSLPAGFQSAGATSQMFDDWLVQATATNLGRFTVRQDFMPEIGDYLFRNAPFWSRLPKEPAEADIIKEIRMTAMPTVGFSAKSTLNTTPAQAAANRQALDDPGQEVKCVSGFIDWSHYARSLYEQQGRPYGDQVARDTADMIDAATMTLELGLFTGNAGSNALQFNGIPQLMRNPNNSHVFTCNITGNNPDSLSQKLVESVTRIMSNRVISHKVTDIICTGAGWNLLQREFEEKRLIMQQMEVLPGLQVPAILTPWGKIPISMTPYLSDIPAAGQVTTDTVQFWFVDINKLVWKGVVPLGGADTFDPQIFEITTFANNVPMTEKRMVLCYGALYAKNRGADIYRLDVTAPAGSAWNYALDDFAA